MKSTGTAGNLHYYNNLDCPTQVNKNNYVSASILSASAIGLFATLQFDNAGKIQINTFFNFVHSFIINFYSSKVYILNSMNNFHIL